MLAGSLTGCAARRRLQASETATAGAAGQPAVSGSGPGNASASATPSTNLADQIDGELQKMDNEPNTADTLNDFSTALPLDVAIGTPGAGAPTGTPAPNQPTAAPRGAHQGAQIDQLLAAMQDQLNKTDIVPEGANP